MPVLMTLRVKGDPAELERRATENPARMQAIADDAKSRGAISHRFYGADDGTLLVVDEWESPEQFQAFFAAHPEIQDLMAEVGVTSEPEVTFWRELDTHDRF
jgi:heme-degrading monooxygenase HmoA